MPAKKQPMHAFEIVPRVTDQEVYSYLKSLGYTHVTIYRQEPNIVMIEGDLAGQHYIANSASTESLQAAERIMTGYWVALTKDDPFDMPTDGSASLYDASVDDVQPFED